MTGMWKWLAGGVGTTAEKIGAAINKNYRSMRGDRAEDQAAIHSENMADIQALVDREQQFSSEHLAVLAQYAAEFASRVPKTKWDSFVDGLNRLPRPVITISVIAAFSYCAYDPVSFARIMMSLELVPDELWTIWIAILSFFFGSRVISQDIRKPRLTEEQRERALAAIKEQETAIIESRSVLVVERPTRKPPPPSGTITPPTDDSLPPEPAAAPGVALDPLKPMLDALIKREGGYVNHPSDKGGPTKYGITLATLSTWRGNPVTAQDVKSLARSEAEEIYRTFYYHGPKIAELPKEIQPQVFDIAVNAGPKAAIRLLQSVLNSFGEHLKLDGFIGPLTANACRKYQSNTINNAMVAARLKFYHDICARKPDQRVFLAGWEKRANEFRVG